MVFHRPEKPTTRLQLMLAWLFQAGEKLKQGFKNVTIEPAIFLIAFSDILDDISVKQMQIDKCCHVDFGFNDTVCDNLVSQFEKENDLIQAEIAQFNVFQEMVSSSLPIFFSFYIGAWCDMFGRKLTMFLFIASRLVGQSILITLAYNMHWAKEWYLLSLIPVTLTGGYAAFRISTNAFIADISGLEQRALRMGMIQLAQLIGKPTAAPLGAYLLREGGFVCVTSASLAGTFLGGLFLAIRMRYFKWKPTEQGPNAKSQRHPFSLYHITDALKVLVKKRSGPNRAYMLILMLIICLQVGPAYGEGVIVFLYIRKRFGWEVEEYSQYFSIVSVVGIVAQTIVIPLLAMLNAKDSIVAILLLTSGMVRNIIKGSASEGWMYYLAALVDMVGNYSAAVIRAMLTNCISVSEFGKIYSIIAALENLLPIGLSQVSASVWKATADTVPGTVFYMSAGYLFIAVVIAIGVHISLRGKRFSEVVKPQPEDKEAEGQEAERQFADFDCHPPAYDKIFISHI